MHGDKKKKVIVEKLEVEQDLATGVIAGSSQHWELRNFLCFKT